MSSLDKDAIKGLLQALEHSLDATDRVSGLCRHLLNAQRDGTAIVASAVQRYEEQLAALTSQRERMREILREVVDFDGGGALMDLEDQPSEGTEKWVEYNSLRLLAEEQTTVLMVRIGLARNALATQLTFAEQSPKVEKYSAVQARNLICSLVSVAGFTFEAVRLAHGGFRTLRALVESSADSDSTRAHVDELVRRVGALCGGKDPSSEFLERARNQLGFHWDEGPIREALQEIVGQRSKGILAEFDHEGRLVYRLATDVLARALFPGDSDEDDAERLARVQRDLLRAVEVLREFFERALIGYVNLLETTGGPSQAES